MHKLSTSHQAWLSQWKEDLLRGSNNDPLVDLSSSSEKWMELNLNEAYALRMDSKIKKIIAEQQDLFKNSGVNVLCVIREVLHWHDEKHSYETPIFLSEVHFDWDKINQIVNLSVSDEHFVNPFLEKMFLSKFEKNLGLWLEQGDFPDSWCRKTISILGNFHYHRFALLRDFDALEHEARLGESPLGYYLQERAVFRQGQKKPSSGLVFPMDIDQTLVFSEIAAGAPLVVEGPPGSGKSQVLANLLFHAASKQQRVVLCSEKKTALDVVESKLTSKGLGLFCQNLTSSKQGKTEFVRSLQESWLALEKQAAQSEDNVQDLLFFEQKRDALSLKLERLSHFPKLQSPMDSLPYELSVYPEFEDFEQYKYLLFQLNHRYSLLFDTSLAQSCFVYLKPFLFRAEHALGQLVNLVKQHREKLLECQRLFGDRIQLNTPEDLDLIQRVLLHAQILSQPLFQKNQDLFVSGSKVFKKFQSVYQKYLVTQQALDLHNKQEGFKWQKPWSHQELLAAKKSFSHDRFWNSEFRNWKKRFVSSYHPEVFTRELAISAIDSCLGIHDLMIQHQHCLDEFHKLGVQHPEVDLPLILQLQRNVNQDYLSLKQTQESFASDFLMRLLKHQSTLHDLNRFVNHHFLNWGKRSVLELFERVIAEADFLIGQREMLYQLLESDPKLPYFLCEIQDFDTLETVVLWGSVLKFKAQNPDLYHYKGSDLLHDVTQIIFEEDRFFEQQIAKFKREKVRQFVDYHAMITAPSSKLTDSDKAFRKKLKSGRTLLVKEFNKTRQHKSIRELLSSDAAPWIHLLKPMLLLNPLSIAQVFPNAAGCIDLLLFDEASQIPFSHAIPAIFRAKQVAVFGDSQQLGPSVYFLQGSAHRADLLSESRHFLPCAELNFHYRSRHESLIAFSNRYFYGNRLNVLPALTDTSRDGVFCHWVDDAVYDSGENRQEAAALVDHLTANLHTLDQLESIGIVTFSEKQLSVLDSVLQEFGSAQVLRLREQERLTLTTLEKVQGDEFDVLYVSLGYGKATDGNFALRFGPVNQEGGEKRLNVLFTRARRALHLFHSVVASDFGHTDNLGVQALKNFLLMHENRSSASMEQAKNDIEICDPFYEKDALVRLMTLIRHAKWSGLSIDLKFRKDLAIR